MVCLGGKDTESTKEQWGYQTAQQRAYDLFRTSFLSRFPGGEVLKELEYRNTGYPSKPGLHKVLIALEDFRRWSKNNDYRKPDGLGISADGSVGELLEVTTVGNRSSAEKQSIHKLDHLTHTVNRIHDLSTYWTSTRWQPTGAELFYPLPPKSNELVRYVCYHPTFRDHALQGIILYEVHAIKKGDTKRLPIVPVAIPEAVQEKMKKSYKQGEIKEQTTAIWAKQFGSEHPVLLQALRGLILVAGIAAAIALVVAIISPIPGDEVLAAQAAASLIALAQNL
ncbi:hypothetical protein [Spirosoma endbachense]|uniref:Restriction endonuclease n=1 Tax=Spirosoma endbachense TaxID=2666025 RepID=A0A6P1VXZ9_9BACT|nr:hypothetical protein [Spirosoma endbachense]QHV96276.1 hypothetical protein GJR95_15185 [Spirosoma endbachense]